MPNYTLQKIYLGDSYKIIGATVYKDNTSIFTIENTKRLKNDIFVNEINQIFKNSMQHNQGE